MAGTPPSFDDYTTKGLTPVQSLWFHDGTLILKAEQSLFKIYQGNLSARSSVFAHMFASPTPKEGNTTLEGCPIIEVYDFAEDISHFLRAIFDSSYFQPPPSSTDLHIVAGVLRMATKYDVDSLRTRAKQHLLSTYPTTLSGWKTRNKYRTIPPISDTPFAALLIAQEFDLPWLIPSIMYCISTHRLEKALDGVHWNGELISLSQNDKRLCVLGRFELMELQNKCLSGMITGFVQAILGCASASCSGTRVGLAQSLCESSIPGVLDFAEENKSVVEAGMCKPCRVAFEGQCAVASRRVWDALPGIFELPSWEELERLRLLALK